MFGLPRGATSANGGMAPAVMAIRLLALLVILLPAADAQFQMVQTPSPTPFKCGNCGSKRKWMIAGTVMGFCGGISLLVYCLKRTSGSKSVVAGI